jgi:hypothetical protein
MSEDDRLFVVHVRDDINATLAGHGGREYASPPQPRHSALALVALLLGSPTSDPTASETTWTRSLAGGRRTVTLAPAA